MRKRPFDSSASLRAYSFEARATLAASAALRKPTAGRVGDVIAVATPPRSRSSIDFCGVQLLTGGVSSLAALSAFTHGGGEMWWCTSMRCGPAVAGVVHPEAASAPIATVPVTSRRRLASGAANAGACAHAGHTGRILPLA